MNRKMVSAVTLTLLLTSMLTLGFSIHSASAYPADFYISVPHYYQGNRIFCGPASLEMVFDFYGPNISQYEIANVARVWWSFGGTASLEDMRRAAHFSNLSSSAGPWTPGSYKGYPPRPLGYAAFTKSGMTLDQLRDVISNGYPLIVTTWYIDRAYGHYRVIVGYNETHITFHDPWYGLPYRGPNVSVTNSQFLVMWECAYNWGLFVSPWNVSISAPNNVEEDSTFTVTATVTYPCPEPFSHEEYLASSCNITLVLPEGLSLAPGENAKKTLGTGNLSPRSTATISWVVQANSPGDFTFSVEAEGKVAGSMPQVGEYPAYDYEDRIGGSNSFKFTILPIPLSVSISPVSTSILVGQSVTFTSTVSGGYTSYSYQWYLNGAPVSGATSNTWTFTPTASGIYYVHLKVTDAKDNTAQSETARITVATVPVGGYSIPIQVPAKAEPVLPYIALMATLTAIFIKLKPKTKRKHRR